MSNKYYVTTAIYYTNAPPHIGHAYEIIAADVIARFHRLLGEDVFFLTGTDEHGIKVEKTAAKQGKSPQAFVDEISERFQTTWRDVLNVDYSRFVRTTEPDHYQVVQAMWNMLMEKGDIYKSSYTGLYCSGCETFCLPKDLTPEGLCPNHLTAPEPVEEENYFFRLSAYKTKLIDYYEAHPDFIQPLFRRNEVINQLDTLEDISVSRAKRSVGWGIPVPQDPDQVVYVWIDALSNYLTGIGWGKDSAVFEKFWPCDVHVIGKDILRFHAIYWPAMLMAAGLPLPETLLVHGFINVAETKISKSLGNVISPQDLMARFELENADPIRYYMMTSTGFGQDGNYTDDEFKNKVNADLANNLGNLLNRTLNMVIKYCDGEVLAVGAEKNNLLSGEDLAQIQTHYEGFRFNEAAQVIMEGVDRANKYVHASEPWTLHKEGKTTELERVLYNTLEALRQLSILLMPLVPTLSQQIWEQLGYTQRITQMRWADILDSPLPAGQKIQLGSPILPRLDSEIVGAGKKR